MTHTVHRLGEGRPLHHGTRGHFRALQAQPAPARSVLGATEAPDTTALRNLGRIAHVSDLHITDVESPARLDFMIDAADDPRYEQSLPTPRPQQLTSSHAAACCLATIKQLTTDHAIDAVVLTGDLVDNAQHNELQRLLTMITGGDLAATRHPAAIEGVHTAPWRDSAVWRPSDEHNQWTTMFGFPADPAIIDAVSRRVRIESFDMATVFVRGNHDALLAGTVAWTPKMASVSIGPAKQRGLPSAKLLADASASFRADPGQFFTGSTTAVTPDPSRRPLERSEFPAAHHIPTHHHRSPFDFVVRPSDTLAVIVVDTVDENGHPDGVLSTDQAQWLADTIAMLDRQEPDTAVIVASHHGPAHHHVTIPHPNRVTGADVVAVLCKHSNVVAWINGHAHAASVTRHASHGQRGFWEITAASIIDWPCQFSTVTVYDHPTHGTVLTVDKHDLTTRDWTGGHTDDPVTDLAGLHRLLAANQADFGRIFPGMQNYDTRDLTLVLPPR